MKRITFTEDWDKLSLPRFTTIRSYNREKEAYYRSLVGQDFIVWRKLGRAVWNGRKLGTATLSSVSIVKPGDLPARELHDDILKGGKPDRSWESRLLAMDRALLLVFENHTGILGGLK